MAGVYVHIPFCGQFCTYCNFYSVKGKEYREKYIRALHKEIEHRKDFFKDTGVQPQTIYFGGGTPSVFPPHVLGETLDKIIKTFGITPTEVSIEVNPNDITPQYARELRNAGFNRVSMGIQSFIDEHLQWMNRRHKALEGEEAFHNLRNAGFNNISLDLIFGYNPLTDELWEYNLTKITELSPEHISAYQMSIEPGSALGRLYEKGKYELLPDNICHNQYSAMQQFLGRMGYQQYEISNFAKRDAATGELLKSRHNSSYWTKEPYIGLGPAAHSYNGTMRLWNKSSVTGYCRHYLEGAAGNNAIFGSYEELSSKDIFNESIMLGLRTVAGVGLSTLNHTFLREIKGEIAYHCRQGNLVKDGDKIRIPSDKLFVSDGIIRDLFV